MDFSEKGIFTLFVFLLVHHARVTQYGSLNSMNIVTLSADFTELVPPHEGIERGRYVALVNLLARVGKKLTEDSSPTFQCFLVSTPELLRVLRSVPELTQIITLRVFSLAAPSEQLVGTVSDEKADDPSSYELPVCDPIQLK